MSDSLDLEMSGRLQHLLEQTAQEKGVTPEEYLEKTINASIWNSALFPTKEDISKKESD